MKKEIVDFLAQCETITKETFLYCTFNGKTYLCTMAGVGFLLAQHEPKKPSDAVGEMNSFILFDNSAQLWEKLKNNPNFFGSPTYNESWKNLLAAMKLSKVVPDGQNFWIRPV